MLRLTREEVAGLAKAGRITLPPDLAIEFQEPSRESRRKAIPPDLGIYVRSFWEANYARFLKLEVELGHLERWEYEPQVFTFPVTRGTTEYRPDFRLTYPNGRQEWVEVKGYMDARSKTQLKRFRKYYPREELRVVGKEWFVEAIRSGLSAVIPHWETGPVTAAPRGERRRRSAA